MMGFLIPIAAKMVGKRFAKAASWGFVLLIAGIAIWQIYSTIYDRGVQHERDEWVEEVAEIRKARDAAMIKANAYDKLVKAGGEKAITDKRKELDDETAKLPDKGLSARQRARADIELRRKQGR